jgi:hypothetical protein
MSSEIAHEPAATASAEGEFRETASGWVGWIVFAAVMMILGGALNAMQGVVAIVNDEWVVWGNRADLYLDLTAWGWAHLVIGVLLVVAGLGVLSGNVLARTIAVLLAGASLIANFLFIPAYPVWALTVIALDVFVILALTVHGRDLA